MHDLLPSSDISRTDLISAIERTQARNASRLHFLAAVRAASAYWRLGSKADATWTRQDLADELEKLVAEGGRKDALEHAHTHRANLADAVERVFGSTLRPKAFDWNEAMRVVVVIRQRWPADRQREFLTTLVPIVFSFDRREGPVSATDPLFGWPRAFLWATPQDVFEAAVRAAETTVRPSKT